MINGERRALPINLSTTDRRFDTWWLDPDEPSEMKPAPSSEPRGQGCSLDEPWHLKLYIAGWTPSSIAALRSIKILEQEYLPAGSTVEVIDLLEHPENAATDHVLAIPTVVKIQPKPVRRLVGNIDDLSKALKILGVVQGS
jgi:circadian clock protein KaiB